MLFLNKIIYQLIFKVKTNINIENLTWTVPVVDWVTTRGVNGGIE